MNIDQFIFINYSFESSALIVSSILFFFHLLDLVYNNEVQ